MPVFKLNNQIVGELDSDSIQLLKAQQKLTKNNQFQVTLNSYGKLDNLTLPSNQPPQICLMAVSTAGEMSFSAKEKTAYPL